MFNCDDIFEKTDEYLDGGLSEDERISFEAHIEVCGECRKNVEFAKSLNCVMRDMPSVLPPDDFLDGLHSKIAADKRIVPFYRRWQPYSALAACVLLAVIIRTNIVGDLNKTSDYLKPATPVPSAYSQSADKTMALSGAQPESEPEQMAKDTASASAQTPETKEAAAVETAQPSRTKEAQRKNDEQSYKTADTASPAQTADESGVYAQLNEIQQSAAPDAASAPDDRGNEVKTETAVENSLENYAAKGTPFVTDALTNNEETHITNSVAPNSAPVPCPTDMPLVKATGSSFAPRYNGTGGGGGSSGSSVTAAAPMQDVSGASYASGTSNTIDKRYKSEVEQIISELGISAADGEYTASEAEYEKLVQRLKQKGIEFDGLYTKKGNSVHFSIEWK